MTILSPTGETRVNSYLARNQWGSEVIALPDGGWLVVWQSGNQDGSSYGIYQQRFDSRGYALGPETQLNTYTTNGQQVPSIALLADGGWVVAWQSWAQGGSGDGVYMQRYDDEGRPQLLDEAGLPMEVQISATSFRSQHSAQITAMPDGGWLVTWTSSSADRYDIHQQRYNSFGEAIGPTTPTGINLSARRVPEGAPRDTPVGALSAVVLDDTQPLT
ncbi:hypothetical protein [Microvirga roseola]|uniref:hypothetical protein n=1 Tax=Microvirga roseola TaxID=2883126 RepID=UPI001E5B29FF|nr:hypothetical protein [Microvirga roseola]